MQMNPTGSVFLENSYWCKCNEGHEVGDMKKWCGNGRGVQFGGVVREGVPGESHISTEAWVKGGSEPGRDTEMGLSRLKEHQGQWCYGGAHHSMFEEELVRTQWDWLDHNEWGLEC